MKSLKKPQKSKEMNGPNEMTERYHKHALYFFWKWKEAEMRNLPDIEDSILKQLLTKIGWGCFGVCTLAKYRAWTAVLKKYNDYVTSKNEVRMIAKFSHSNIVCLIDVLKWQNRLDIVTSFYSINDDGTNLCDIPAETTTNNWTNLLNGLCSGIWYLHNDTKSNNIVLDGCNLFEAEDVLLDFGKATDQNSPKKYDKPEISSNCCSSWEIHNFTKYEIPTTSNIQYFTKAPKDFLTEFAKDMLTNALAEQDVADLQPLAAFRHGVQGIFNTSQACKQLSRQPSKGFFALYWVASHVSDTHK